MWLEVRTVLCALGLGGAALVAAGCSPATGASSASATAKKDPDRAPVEVVKPERREVTRRIDLVGTLMAWEEATLYAKTSGYLHSIRVDRGDRVRKGEVIAVLDIPEMTAERAQVEASERQALAEVEKERAQVQFQAATVRRLMAIRDEEPRAMTDQEMDVATERLDAAEATLRAAESRVGVVRAELSRLEALEAYSRIVAPMDGTVSDRFVDPGALVTAGTQSKPTPVVRVVNSSKLRLTVDVPESDVGYVEEGKTARLRVDALPDRVFDGTITRYSRSLDPKTRTMRSEILVANPDGLLAAGMFGRVSIDIEKRLNVLALPPACVRYQKDQPYVFVEEKGGARRVNVVCGADDGNALEIVSGLEGIESVIVNPSASLTDGALVSVRRSGAGEDGR